MNQKSFANIVLVIVVVVFLGAVGYFAFVKKSEPIAQQQTPTQTTNPTKTPTSSPKDETANWKTYTNIQYGFEFRYPMELKYLSSGEFSYKDFKGVVVLQNFPLSKSPNYSDEATFQMVVYVKENLGEEKSNLPYSFINRRYTILFENSLNKIENPDIFNQILSTFKFTN